jgi:hypothetical protein
MSNDIAAALADLRKVVEENPDRDRFPVGTVIRWTASERYTYVAVKTGYAWFTTARPGNPFVKQQMNYEELREVLARDEVSDIAVSANWVRLDGTPASNEVPVEPRPLANVNTQVRSPRFRDYQDDYPGLSGESI